MMRECNFYLERDGKKYKCINKGNDNGFHALVMIHGYWNGKFHK